MYGSNGCNEYYIPTYMSIIYVHMYDVYVTHLTIISNIFYIPIILVIHLSKIRKKINDYKEFYTYMFIFYLNITYISEKYKKRN